MRSSKWTGTWWSLGLTCDSERSMPKSALVLTCPTCQAELPADSESTKPKVRDYRTWVSLFVRRVLRTTAGYRVRVRRCRNCTTIFETVEFPSEIFDGFKNSSVAETDNALRLMLLSFSTKEEARAGLYKIVAEELDQDLSVTMEKIDFLAKLLAVPELNDVAIKFAPELVLIRQTLSKTTELDSSLYSEAGVKPELRQLMRKQRLLTLTGKVLAHNESNNKEQLLRELNTAYDPTLDTPLIHEAFRYLIAAVPNALEILGPNKEELSARDSTIQMMLNPPPTVETSLVAIITVSILFLVLGIFGLFYWRKVDRLEQRLVLAEGLSFEERRELQKILAKFGLSSNVSLAELQSAFRRLAKKIHPDAQSDPNADESFIKLQEDYARAKELISAFR